VEVVPRKMSKTLKLH